MVANSVPEIQTPREAFKLMFVNLTAEKRKFDRETIDASSILDTVSLGVLVNWFKIFPYYLPFMSLAAIWIMTAMWI